MLSFRFHILSLIFNPSNAILLHTYNFATSHLTTSFEQDTPMLRWSSCPMNKTSRCFYQSIPIHIAHHRSRLHILLIPVTIAIPALVLPLSSSTTTSVARSSVLDSLKDKILSLLHTLSGTDNLYSFILSLVFWNGDLAA